MSIKKIAVIGPESTGKSTLSEALAKELNTQWVPEYARSYLNELGRPYEETDLLTIAKGQLNTQDQLEQTANRFLICDTDLYVVKVWSEHSYGRCDPWILHQIAIRTYDLYLLSYIDIEWEDDPLREHGTADMRAYFYHQYRDIVTNANVPWLDIRGTTEQRIQKALKGIRKL